MGQPPPLNTPLVNRYNYAVLVSISRHILSYIFIVIHFIRAMIS